MSISYIRARCSTAADAAEPLDPDLEVVVFPIPSSVPDQVPCQETNNSPGTNGSSANLDASPQDLSNTARGAPVQSPYVQNREKKWVRRPPNHYWPGFF